MAIVRTRACNGDVTSYVTTNSTTRVIGRELVTKNLGDVQYRTATTPEGLITGTVIERLGSGLSNFFPERECDTRYALV